MLPAFDGRPWDERGFEAITTRFHRAVPARGELDLFKECDLRLTAPGFWETGRAMEAERSTAAKLGRDLWERFGLTLVLLAQLENQCTPGFDGVVIDQTLRPIANVSIKNPRALTPGCARAAQTSANGSARLCLAHGWSDLLRGQAAYFDRILADALRLGRPAFKT